LATLASQIRLITGWVTVKLPVSSLIAAWSAAYCGAVSDRF
jgi:hypothetical protein